MGLTLNTNVWKWLLAVTILLTLLITLLFYFQGIFAVIILGTVLIIFTDKLRKNYQERMVYQYNLQRWQRRLLGYGLLIFWAITIIFLITTSIKDIGNTITTITENHQTLLTAYEETILPYLPTIIQTTTNYHTYITQAQIYILKTFSTAITNLGYIIINGILIIPIMYYMYYKKRTTLSKQFFNILPKKLHNGFVKAASDIGKELHEFLNGKIIESIIVGALCCLGFYLGGLPGWLILGLLAGFLNIVPYIGPILGAIPPLLIALFTDGTTALYVLITIIIAQIIDNFYLQPFMLSDKVKMDPLLSILLILIGAQLYGIMGMIFAIPIYIIYKIVLRESYLALTSIYKEKR
ncbi:MAG: AI-2E family transporter [Nanoarchaeota archaeon]|nr:AI-2E family transporter [Nanoarchaeota archaeon]